MRASAQIQRADLVLPPCLAKPGAYGLVLRLESGERLPVLDRFVPPLLVHGTRGRAAQLAGPAPPSVLLVRPRQRLLGKAEQRVHVLVGAIDGDDLLEDVHRLAPASFVV